MKVRRIVSVHEETVKNAAKGNARYFKKPRRKAKKQIVTVMTIDPLLVKWMKKNKVNYKDVDFVSPTVLIIKNK